MDLSHDIAVRSARNRLIDLLGLGDCHPLTDLAVTVEPPKVTFGDAAQVLVHQAQAGVRYQLLAPDGKLLDEATGPGAPLRIPTPAVLENVTFPLRAVKASAGPGLPAAVPRLLQAAAPVKVGLDTGLVVRFRDAPGLALLDPGQADPPPSAPRLVDHGTSWLVEIEKSQEGVDYVLKLDGRLAQEVRRGDRQTLVLPTGPVVEDLVIQVQATKRFALADKETERQDLAARLVLKVRADPACGVQIDGPAVLDHGQAGALRLLGTQRSAAYRVHLRPVADADFVHVPGPGDDAVAIPVDGRTDLRVRWPGLAGGAPLPEGFEPVPGEAVPGNGGELRLPLPAQDRDWLLIVQAVKQHALAVGPDGQSPPPVGPGGHAPPPVGPDGQPALATRASAVWLGQATVLLTRPDPRPPLRLQLALADGLTGDSLQVTGGQPGVYYHFTALPDGPALAWPAYFHQRDRTDPGRNKGLGQLAVEIDFSLSSAGDADAATADAARRPPPEPRLALPPLPVGSRLAIRAVKAQTGVDVALVEAALVAAVPAVLADPPVIDCGGLARVRVPQPDPQDRFELRRDGQPLEAAVETSGDGLVLTAGPWRADPVLTLLARRGADGALQVAREVAVALRVRPDPALALQAAPAQVPPGGSADILVLASQPGVDYQLLADGRPLGLPVAGQGDVIGLPTGPLAADTLFGVVATRSDLPALSVVLEAQVQINLAGA